MLRTFALFRWQHTYRGSLARHLAVEKAINLLRDLHEWASHSALDSKLWSLAYIPVAIFYGLNCNFSLRDITFYLAHWLRLSGLSEYPPQRDPQIELLLKVLEKKK